MDYIDDKKEPVTTVHVADNPEYTEYLELCDIFQGERLGKLTVCAQDVHVLG